MTVCVKEMKWVEDGKVEFRKKKFQSKMRYVDRGIKCPTATKLNIYRTGMGT